MNSDLIKKYFPDISLKQTEQFDSLGNLYHDWNSKINVISRKDIDNLYLHHVLHSLSIAAFLGPLKDGTSVIDVGTGGGFPGIPLAIMYPDVRFHLVDRIAKKLRVVSEISSQIGLTNVTIQHGDMSECHAKFDFAVSRAVMKLDSLVRIVKKNIRNNSINSHINGLICLKGGEISEESQGIPYPIIEIPVTEYFNEPFFESKMLVYIPMTQK